MRIVITIFLLFLMGMLSLFPLKDLSSLAFLSATPESSVFSGHLNFQRFHRSNKHYINQGVVFYRVKSKVAFVIIIFQ